MLTTILRCLTFPVCTPEQTLGEGDIQTVCGTLERMAKGENASETELHATLQKLARGSQNFRTLWCEMPEVSLNW